MNDLPRYLPDHPEDRCVRRRRRALHRATQAALFPVHVLVALVRFLGAPRCEL